MPVHKTLKKIGALTLLFAIDTGRGKSLAGVDNARTYPTHVMQNKNTYDTVF